CQKYLALLESERNYDAKMSLSAILNRDFDWWESRISDAFNPIRQQEYALEIFSDTSLTGWGAACNGETTYGAWDELERKKHINYLELVAAFYALQCFAARRYDCEILLRIDNTTAVAYINQMGGIQYPHLNGITRKIWQWCKQRSLWITASYISSQENAEADQGSRIINVDTEWELAHWAFQAVIRRFGVPKIDLFATRNNKKCEKFCSWHRDPEAVCVDAFTIKWTKLKFYAFPPFALILRILRKIQIDQAQGVLIENPPSVSGKNDVSGRDIVRQNFRRLEDWAKFSVVRNFDMFAPQISQIVEWLTVIYKAGASYGTLNTGRSALSWICGDRVGKIPIISRFLKSVFNKKPTKAKYERIYDLEPVLKELEKLYPLEDFSLQDLTDKLVVLLAIVTAHRKQTLSLIKISNIREISNGYEIEIPDRIKTTRPGSCQPSLTLPTFRGNPKLCVATTLKRYLAVTKNLRESIDSLFITTRKPFKAAAKDTISRWIRAFLGKCGIGESYGPHSIRHAATSAAFKKVVNIAVIKRLAGWSEKSTVFDRFYNRPIVKENSTFAEAILA
ncbi:uncharacterized protein LOC112454508, partial [Temnothorax curvispinosus]|uniref:Uncharacterized protein LOC112454508 n=1 Tax=Temnothorax curvispinosus TaxID=300111 RepID=A0A6J1PRS2_9HYME